MSAIPVVTPADLPHVRGGAAARPRIWIRALSFAALSLYGVERWSRLLAHPPGWRLFGLALVAIALAVGVPLLRHLTEAWPRRGGTIVSGAAAALLMLAALPIAGLRWEWVVHLRVAVSARAIGGGLGSLADVLVPYLGDGYEIRLVIVLGAAVLLLDAAAALAFAGRPGAPLRDGRRAAAALPLVALAVVPSTLVRPGAPALQGLILFVLLAVFMWGERIEGDGVAAACAVALAAGIVGAIAGPLVEGGHAWVDYRAWAGTTTQTGLDSFDWNQSYGPLDWPTSGRTVLIVHAHRGDYWKAEDLSQFNGVDWVSGASPDQPALPAPDRVAVRDYSQTMQVTIDAMRTSQVIGGSGVSTRPSLAGGVVPGSVAGTWIASRALQNGDAYELRTYSPSPSPSMLRDASRDAYPWSALAPDLSLILPGADGAGLAFPGFHQPVGSRLRAVIAASPYAPAFALAQRLAARSATPYDFVHRVQAYLDNGDFSYDQQTQRSTYPLLEFLLRSHIGYCQQFSGAMALLLRMGGVPARVAAGFTSGRFDPTDQTWTVSDIDAHAWVESWFPRFGWVKFDPTPSSAPARGGNGGPGVRAQREALLRHRPATLPQAKPAPIRRPDTTTSHASAAAHPGSGSGGSSGPGPWPWIGLGILLGTLAAAGAWREYGRRVTVDPVAELERALSRTGRPLAPGVTLASLERRLHDSPEAAGYVRSLRLARYGDAAPSPSPAGRRALRAQLRAGLGISGRLRALWALPPRPTR